jgi:hypothetical protein
MFPHQASSTVIQERGIPEAASELPHLQEVLGYHERRHEQEAIKAAWPFLLVLPAAKPQ